MEVLQSACEKFRIRNFPAGKQFAIISKAFGENKSDGSESLGVSESF